MEEASHVFSSESSLVIMIDILQNSSYILTSGHLLYRIRREIPVSFRIPLQSKPMFMNLSVSLL